MSYYYKGPPEVEFKTGPNCEGCPFRQTSIGYVPPTIPGMGEEGDRINSIYLFLLDKPGRDDVETGRTAQGGIGKTFNRLLQNNTRISRSQQTVANTVRCWPIVWTTDGSGNQVPLRHKNGDYVSAEPSKAQVRECATRYGDVFLDTFDGKYIIALGKIPAEYLLGRPVSIQAMRGSIYEPGLVVPCDSCMEGKQETRKQVNCKECKGKGKLGEGRGKSRTERDCTDCAATGKTEKIKFKDCGTCEGSGYKPADPEKKNVCEKLKPHQKLMLTYHPMALNHNPNYESVINRDYKLMEQIDEWMEVEQNVSYEVYPAYPHAGTTEMLERSGKGYPISIDIETTGSLNPIDGELYCVGATSETTKGYSYYPEDPRVREFLRQPKIIGQNFVLYDQWWFKHKGFEIPDETKIYDTRYLGKLLNPDTPNDLVYLTGEFADPPIRGYWKTKEAYGRDKEGISCIDVDATLRVFHGQMEAIDQLGQNKIVEDYIVPMSKVVFDMRWAGMKIDRSKMDETRELILRELETKRTIIPWTKKDGSPGTENQSGEVTRYLYETLRLPVINDRKSGKPTGNSEAREELLSRLETGHRTVRHLSDDETAFGIELIKALSECRELSKLEGNFLRYKLSGEDFVHPALNMGGSARGKHEAGRGTASWRFSCGDPNAQQVPKRARNIFIPDDKDWEIISIDLRQAEIVGFLWYAQEWGILNKVLRYGMDAHRELAGKIVGRQLDPNSEEDEKIRDEYKTTTFALLYGESPRTTAQRTRKSLEEVRQSRDFYFRMLPGVAEYRTTTIENASRDGYVESPFGFRRYVYIENEYGRAANQACNAKIQNIPPIVVGRSMIGMHRELPKPARLAMQVHDEIIIVAPKEARQQVVECAIDWMRSPVPELYAPELGMAGGLVFNVDIEVGDNWRDMKKITKEFGL